MVDMSSVAIMREARNAAKRYTKELVSQHLKYCLDSIGYYQEDTRKSGFQYLDQILKSEFTDGLPRPMSTSKREIRALSVEDFYAWCNNVQIIGAVKEAIRYSSMLRGV